MSGLNRLIWLLVVVLGIYLFSQPVHPVWIDTGSFLENNKNKNK